MPKIAVDPHFSLISNYSEFAKFNDKTADNFDNPGSEVGQPKIAKNLGENSPKIQDVTSFGN